MNHYMDFDLTLIEARNEQMRGEVRSLRLEKRLRKASNPRLSRLAERGRLLGGGSERRAVEGT